MGLYSRLDSCSAGENFYPTDPGAEYKGHQQFFRTRAYDKWNGSPLQADVFDP